MTSTKVIDAKKRHRGDQFLIHFHMKLPTDSVSRVVADQTKALGSEIRCLIVSDYYCIIKLSSPVDFRGESSFTVNSQKPTISSIRQKDIGLFKEIDNIKKENHVVIIDNYKQVIDKIYKDEDQGFVFTRIKTNPKFDSLRETRFGKGHRRVNPIFRDGRLIGYKFIPFNEYPPQWASDIYGYDSFDDALKDVSPYMGKEVKHLRDLYMLKPRIISDSIMIPTRWQENVIEILNSPIKYDDQERTFYWFADFIGHVGKSMLVRHILSTRDDTLVISSSGKMSDLVCSIKDSLLSSSKIKNIILDIPRETIRDTEVDFHIFDDEKHDGDTIKFMESCVNGRFTSLKYDSTSFDSDYGLRVIVLSNSLPLLTMASLDRWSINVIKNQNELQIQDLRCDKSLTTRRNVIDFYLSQPQFIEYLKEHSLRHYIKSSRKYNIY